MFNPQLALHKYKEDAKKKPAWVNQPYYIFEKYDGWYGSILLIPNDTSQPFILSRQGRAIPSVQWLAESIDFSNEHSRIKGRLIFEILLRDVTVFHELNGILNRTKGDCAARSAYVKVHDFIPYDGENLPFHHRYELARDVVQQLNNPNVELAEFICTTNNIDGTTDGYARRVWENGGEGIILKRATAPYSEGKRNADLMKIKLEDTVDLQVVSVARGEGKYSNTLGALVCSDKAGVLHYISGMSDLLRDLWWKSPHSIVGSIVEVCCMCKLPNGNLREPRFKAVRHDKNPTEID